jgi:hypothetical protein
MNNNFGVKQLTMAFLWLVLLSINGNTAAVPPGDARDAVKQCFLNKLPSLGDGWTLGPDDVYVMTLPPVYRNNPHTPVRAAAVPHELKIGEVALGLVDGRWVGIVSGRQVSLGIEIPDVLPDAISAEIQMGISRETQRPIQNRNFTLVEKDCLLGVPGLPAAPFTKLLDVANHYKAHSEMQSRRKFSGRLGAQTLWITKTDPQSLRTSLLNVIYGIDRVRHRIGIFLNIGESDGISGFVGVCNEALKPVTPNKPLPDERYYNGLQIYQTVTRTNGWDFPTDTWIQNWLGTIGLSANEYGAAWRWMNTIIRNTGVKVARDPLEARHVEIRPPLPAGTPPGYYYIIKPRKRVSGNDLICIGGEAQLRCAMVHKETWQPTSGIATTYEVSDYLLSSLERHFRTGTIFLPAENLIAGRWPVGVYSPTGSLYRRMGVAPITIEARDPLAAGTDTIIPTGPLTDEATTKKYFEDLSYAKIASLTLSKAHKIKYQDFKECLERMKDTLESLTIQRDVHTGTVKINQFSYEDYKDFMLTFLPHLRNLRRLDLFFKYDETCESITTNEAVIMGENIVGRADNRAAKPGLPNLQSLKLTLGRVSCYNNPIPIVGLVGFGIDVVRKIGSIVYEQHLRLAEHIGVNAYPALTEVKFYDHHGFRGKADRVQILDKVNAPRRAAGRSTAVIINADGTTTYNDRGESI